LIQVFWDKRLFLGTSGYKLAAESCVIFLDKLRESEIIITGNISGLQGGTADDESIQAKKNIKNGADLSYDNSDIVRHGSVLSDLYF
jgi:hypothetical protein